MKKKKEIMAKVRMPRTHQFFHLTGNSHSVIHLFLFSAKGKVQWGRGLLPGGQSRQRLVQDLGGVVRGDGHLGDAGVTAVFVHLQLAVRALRRQTGRRRAVY